MRDCLYIGPVPSNEMCAQVGDDDFTQRATVECRVYADQLRRMFPAVPESGARFATQWQEHDFGRYAEVVIYYDPSNEAQVMAAYDAEGRLPEEWDDAARTALAAAGFPPGAVAS